MNTDWNWLKFLRFSALMVNDNFNQILDNIPLVIREFTLHSK
jgi:hypothetical protein